jgi:site-specific DNA-methyltransferase (adenine-specific)
MNDIFNENVPLKTETPAFAKHVLPAVPLSEVYLEDCVTALKRYADNHFDLAIVDPPYGIDINKAGWIKQKKQANPHTDKNWDAEIPSKEYFDELFRVSKNQIIWGGNYFTEFLPASRCFLIWDKVCRMDQADCELAWASFDKSARIFTYAKGNESGFAPKLKGTERAGINIHPTQKPIALYAWLLHKYAQPNDLILDTHLGSGSSRIAAYKGGFNFVGFEIDKEYYEKQEKRFNDFKSQLRLF